MMRRYMILNPADQVAVALEDLPPGTRLEIAERGSQVSLDTAVAFGHKFALVPIAAGEPVRKYGVVIGIATQDILPGQHVHLHNLRSRMIEEPAQDGAWSNRIQG